MEIQTLNCSLLKLQISFNKEFWFVFEEEADEPFRVTGGILLGLNRLAGRGGGGGGAGTLELCELVGIGGGGAGLLLFECGVLFDARQGGLGGAIGAFDDWESFDV